MRNFSYKKPLDGNGKVRVLVLTIPLTAEKALSFANCFRDKWRGVFIRNCFKNNKFHEGYKDDLYCVCRIPKDKHYYEGFEFEVLRSELLWKIT